MRSQIVFVQRGIANVRSANISAREEETYADKPVPQQSISKSRPLEQSPIVQKRNRRWTKRRKRCL